MLILIPAFTAYIGKLECHPLLYSAEIAANNEFNIEMHSSFVKHGT